MLQVNSLLVPEEMCLEKFSTENAVFTLTGIISPPVN
jgi:hypothetical protein